MQGIYISAMPCLYLHFEIECPERTLFFFTLSLVTLMRTQYKKKSGTFEPGKVNCLHRSRYKNEYFGGSQCATTIMYIWGQKIK